MTGDGARAGRAVALSVAMVIGACGLLLVPSPASTSASPTGDCSTTSVIAEPCTPDPVLTTTTASTAVTEASSTSTTRQTTTTARATATTSRASGQAVARSTTTSTTLSTPTSANLLVPGDGSQGAELTTTTVATPTKINAGGPSDGTLIALVIVGLVLIAGVVGVLTWRYWIATRPPLRDRDTATTSAG